MNNEHQEGRYCRCPFRQGQGQERQGSHQSARRRARSVVEGVNVAPATSSPASRVRPAASSSVKRPLCLQGPAGMPQVQQAHQSWLTRSSRRQEAARLQEVRRRNLRKEEQDMATLKDEVYKEVAPALMKKFGTRASCRSRSSTRSLSTSAAARQRQRQGY